MRSFVAIRDVPLSIDEAVAKVAHDGAGGVSIFLGIVRAQSGARPPRPVVRLEYEAYVSMANAEMRRVADELCDEMPTVRVAAVHRTGSLVVGETAVICAASAPHRGDAFRACRALIDRIKARVPIWKREHGPDGAYWVDWQDARCGGDDHAGPHEASCEAEPCPGALPRR